MKATVAQALQIGWKFHQARNLPAAEDVYRQVLAAAPHHADAWCYLGILLYDLGRYDDSIAAYQEAIRLQPVFPVAHSNLGNSLVAVERFAEAEASIRRAIEQQPDYANAWGNLGAAQVRQGKLAEAQAALEHALQLAPQNEAAHRNLGAAYVRQGRLAEGERHSAEALRINPRSAEAHRNRAIVWLLTGDWDRGWEEYEWRWQCPEQTLPTCNRPMYAGEALQDRTLLLLAEQGLGDTLQFVRYAALARRRGARVLVECPLPLLPVLSTYREADGLVPRGEPMPEFDYYLPMMSAPRVFATRVRTVPADVPYLYPDPQRVAAWRSRLPSGTWRIGIAWQGSRQHPIDQQRSVPLTALAPLARGDVALISLQKGEGTEQLEVARQEFPVLDFGADLDARQPFVDSAAILSQLDLFVTVDTALAHLAGALGVPVWLALSTVPDWRWMLERQDTPWYPTIRLFRQSRPGDWSAVFAAMAAELPAAMRGRPRTAP